VPTFDLVLLAKNTTATEVLYGGAAGGGKSHLMRVAAIDLDGGTTLPNLDTAVRVSRDVARAKYRVWKAGRMSPRKWGERLDDNNELGAKAVIRRLHSTCLSASVQTARWKGGIIPPLHE
jgi:hypothetical protein